MTKEEFDNIIVGDAVVVAEDLVGGKYYEGVYFNPNMKKMCGNTYTVFDKGDQVTLKDESDESWVFSASMLVCCDQHKDIDNIPNILELFN